MYLVYLEVEKWFALNQMVLLEFAQTSQEAVALAVKIRHRNKINNLGTRKQVNPCPGFHRNRWF